MNTELCDGIRHRDQQERHPLRRSSRDERQRHLRRRRRGRLLRSDSRNALSHGHLEQRRRARQGRRAQHDGRQRDATTTSRSTRRCSSRGRRSRSSVWAPICARISRCVRKIDREKKWYRALFFWEDRLVGGLMLGKGNRAGKRKYVEAIKSQAALPQAGVGADARLDRVKPDLLRRFSGRLASLAKYCCGLGGGDDPIRAAFGVDVLRGASASGLCRDGAGRPTAVTSL